MISRKIEYCGGCYFAFKTVDACGFCVFYEKFFTKNDRGAENERLWKEKPKWCKVERIFIKKNEK